MKDMKSSKDAGDKHLFERECLVHCRYRSSRCANGAKQHRTFSVRRSIRAAAHRCRQQQQQQDRQRQWRQMRQRKREDWLRSATAEQRVDLRRGRRHL